MSWGGRSHKWTLMWHWTDLVDLMQRGGCSCRDGHTVLPLPHARLLALWRGHRNTDPECPATQASASFNRSARAGNYGALALAKPHLRRKWKFVLEMWVRPLLPALHKLGPAPSAPEPAPKHLGRVLLFVSMAAHQMGRSAHTHTHTHSKSHTHTHTKGQRT